MTTTTALPAPLLRGDKLEIAAVQAEISMFAAQIAAIKRLRK